MANRTATMNERPVGWDVSESMHDLRVLCPLHHGGPRTPGTALYRGDEWAAYEAPQCACCGVEIVGLKLVSPM